MLNGCFFPCCRTVIMGSVGRLKVIVGETARVATRKPRAKRNFMELVEFFFFIFQRGIFISKIIDR